MIQSRSSKLTIIGIFLLIMTGLFISTVDFSNANTVGGNYKNVTVRTTVNITNSKPEILNIIVYQESNTSLRNITLSAGLSRIVTCNLTVRDWNGYNDIVNVNATLYHVLNSTFNAIDDNNTHYTNANCTNIGNGVNYTQSYTCGFNVRYYALNGSWICNATAVDTYNKTGNLQNTTVIAPLYALNVTDGIDYGNVSVEDTSVEKTADITNFGNMNINISVEGYGVVRGDGLAMNCSIAGNITVDNERFSTASGAFGTKTNLATTPVNVSGLTVSKQWLPGSPVTNITYWQLYIPPNPAGNCSGYIIFQAEVS